MVLCVECGQRVRQHPVTAQSVAELESEMAQIEDLMTRLAHQRTCLRRKINSLSPISRLPPEVLTEIFFLACIVNPLDPPPLEIPSSPALSLSSRPASPSPSTLAANPPPPITPLFLGSICVEWRNIAWSTPLLWRSLTLNVSMNVPHERHLSQRHLLSEWLLRAGTMPLHIKLSSTDEHESIFYTIRSIMDVLLTRSMYWGSVEFLLPPNCHDLLSNASLEYPILTSVCLKPPKGTISTFSQPPDMFRKAPMLTEVDLSGYDYSSMVLPWSQLRKFRTQFLTVKECLNVLKRSSNLAQVFLESVYSPDASNLMSSATRAAQQKQAQLVHHSLQTLEVTLIKGAAMSLLDAISLPALKELSMHYVGTEHVSLLPVISLISRSSATCSLTKLCISRSTFAEDDLVRCLEAVPTLVELQICVREVVGGGMGVGAQMHQGLSETFVKRMCPSRSSVLDPADCASLYDADAHCAAYHLLLPNLQIFSYEGLVLCSSEALLDMLVWRWGSGGRDASYGVAHLKSVSILSRQQLWMEQKEMDKLQWLRQQGMKVVLRPGLVVTKQLP